MHVHKWTLEDIMNMLPWEREIYVDPLAGAYKEGERKTRRTEKENETMSENVDSRNEVEIDLEKYDKLINNLYEKEKEIAKMKADAEAQKKSIAPKRKEEY